MKNGIFTVFSWCFHDPLIVKNLVFMRVFAVTMKFSYSILDILSVFFFLELHYTEVEKKKTFIQYI